MTTTVVSMCPPRVYLLDDIIVYKVLVVRIHTRISQQSSPSSPSSSIEHNNQKPADTPLRSTTRFHQYESPGIVTYSNDIVSYELLKKYTCNNTYSSGIHI